VSHLQANLLTATSGHGDQMTSATTSVGWIPDFGPQCGQNRASPSSICVL